MNPKSGFANMPTMGRIVYMVPTITVEKPSCRAKVGIKGTTGAVPKRKIKQYVKTCT